MKWIGTFLCVFWVILERNNGSKITMKNKILIKNGNADYECYIIAEQDLFPGYDEINTKLNWVREKVKEMHFSTGKHPVEYDICFYDSKQINAFAVKITDRRYVIAVSIKLLIGMREELEEYFKNPDLKKYFWGNKRSAKRHAQKVCEYILLYVILHEYYHILNGHCDSAYAIGKLLVEAAISRGGINNRYSQILECDADYCAARSCMYIINDTYKGLDDRISEIRFLGFSIYYIFLKFQEQGYENMHYMVDLYANNHPAASIRFVYTSMVISNGILNLMSKQAAFKELWDIIEVSIYFDRVYYDADTFDLSLAALAYTKRGTRHLNDLHTGWNEVRDELEKVSYVSLKYNEPIDFTNHVWVDKDGNMILDNFYEIITKYYG